VLTAPLAGWRAAKVVATARAISVLGDELAAFALLLREKNDGAGALAIALMYAASHLPLIVLAPWVGSLADRIPARRLIPALCLVQAVIILALAPNASIPTVFLLLLLLFSAQAAMAPTWSTVLPALVGEKLFPRAISLSQSLQALAGIIAPALAAFLVVQTGYVLPLLIDAATFVLLAGIPFLLALPRRKEPAVGTSSTPTGASEGMRLMARDPVLRTLILLLAGFVFALSLVGVAQLFFVLDVLGASPKIFGLASSTVAFGIFLTALVNSRRNVPPGKMPLNMGFGMVVMVAGIFFLGAAGNWIIIFPAMFLIGVGNAFLNAYISSMLILRAPEEVRGRVVAGLNGAIGLAQVLGLSAAGLLVSLLGSRAVILAAAAGGALAIAVLFPPLLRAIRSSQEISQP
jgi:MFS family permease